MLLKILGPNLPEINSPLDWDRNPTRTHQPRKMALQDFTESKTLLGVWGAVSATGSEITVGYSFLWVEITNQWYGINEAWSVEDKTPAVYIFWRSAALHLGVASDWRRFNDESVWKSSALGNFPTRWKQYRPVTRRGRPDNCTHGRPQNFFQGGKSRYFAYLFQIVGDATQMDVRKKKMSNVTATVACSVCFACKKILHLANVCFSEHGYFKTELAEF